MKNTKRQRRYREQVADLILKDGEGRDLGIVSPLEIRDGIMSFLVAENSPDGDCYQVKIEIKEM